MKALKSVLSVVGLVAVLFGVPLLLIWLVGWPGPDHLLSWEEVRRTVVQRDFGTNFLLGLLAVVGWLLWLQVLWATIWELSVNVGRVRVNARPRRAPLVAAPIGRVVGVSVMALLALFAANDPGPALAGGPLQMSPSATVSTTLARASSQASNDLGPSSQFGSRTRSVDVALSDTVSAPSAPVARIWHVEAGDNLWDIAETALGDGSRVDELIGMNPHLSPSMVIQPGEQIRLPADATAGMLEARASDVPGEVVVERGDNLWNLTEAHWGSTDMERIEQVAEANQISDPDLIYPGDVIDLNDPDALPAPTPAQEPPGRQTFDVDIGAADAAGVDVGESEPAADAGDTNASPGSAGGFNGFAAPRVSPAAPLPPPSGGDATPSDRSALSRASTNGTQPADTTNGPDSGSTEADESTAGVLAWDVSLLLGGGLLGLIAARRRRGWRTRRGVGAPSVGEIAAEQRMRAARFVWDDDSPDARRRRELHWWLRTFDRVGAEAASAGTEVLAVVAAENESVTVFLAGPVEFPSPWVGAERVWAITPDQLAAGGDDSDVELLRLQASIGGGTAPAMTELGTATSGERVFVNIEALGTLEIGGPEPSAEAILNAIAMGLCSNDSLSSAALIGVGVDDELLLGHPGAMASTSYGEALTQAEMLVGTNRGDSTRSAMRTTSPAFGEVWEPAIILAGPDAAKVRSPSLDGVVLVSAAPVLGPAHVLVPDGDEWLLRPLGIRLTPIGVPEDQRAVLASLLDHAASGASADITIDRPGDSEPRSEPDIGEAAEQEIDLDALDGPAPFMVRVLGPVGVDAPAGPVAFQYSKSQELLVWLTFHRRAPTRTGARGALWNFNIREQPFRNVISDLRHSLDRAAPPPADQQWLERTDTELLPLHPVIHTDAAIVERALQQSRELAPADKIEILQPAVELIRGLPFTDVEYLWPDAEGLVSSLIKMSCDAFIELAEAHRAVGDGDAAVNVARRGLDLFAGHEGLVAVYLQALSDIGDDQGANEAWSEYEATLCDDAWGPYEPSPELVALRRQQRDRSGSFAPPMRSMSE